MASIRTAIVLAGGAPVDPELIGPLPDHQLVIAADSGLAQAPALGLEVDLLVGDLDSASPAAVAAAEAAGVQIERHPADKDATDLDLALAAAAGAGATAVVVVGGGGGRLDHLLGNALLLGSPAFAGVTLEWRVDGYRAALVRTSAALPGAPGDLVTLLPVGGAARGVRTAGLRWPLAGEDLSPGSTRGMSNEMTEPVATVSLDSGVLLALHRRAG